MPSTSAKQHRFMEAVAHNPAFAKKAGIPQKVGQEFSKADKGKKFSQGGTMKHEKEKEMKQAKTLERLAKEEREEAKGMKRGGHAKHHVKKMATGGMTTGKHGVSEKSGMTTAKMSKAEVGGKLKHGEHSIQKKGHTRALHDGMKSMKPLGMKHGGKTHHKK